MDAVDAALVRFRGARVAELCYRQFPIAQALRARVRQLNEQSKLGEVVELDARLGVLFAQSVRRLLRMARCSARSVRAIGSHGQTVLHRPSGPFRSSLQIGDPNIIACSTGITTVSDFRRMDLAARGEGAPLAPAFHAAQFRSARCNRCVLNIGGIANVTLLPRDPRRPVIGLDTGPGNGLLDDWIRRHRGLEFDRDGAWARRGKPHPGLLAEFMRDSYFRRRPPKSTGREHFNLDWVDRARARIAGRVPAVDVQATLLQLSAATIAAAVRRHAPPDSEVLVCGGGVHNAALMHELRVRLHGMRVESTAAAGLDPDCIEAVTFAWLAKQRLAGRPGNLPAVTGARHALPLGGVYEPGKNRG